MALTPKRRDFVKQYLVDFNGTQAAIRAGYSPKGAHVEASRLLRDPKVQAALRFQIGARNRRTEVSQDYVIKGLTEVFERCMKRVPVMIGAGENRHQAMEAVPIVNPETGEEETHLLGVWKFDANGANQALKLLGQHLALFTKNIALDHKNLPAALRVVLVDPPSPDDP